MTSTVLHVITGLGSGGAERMLTRVVLADHGPNAPRQVVISLMDDGMHGVTLRTNGVELHCLHMRRRLSFLALLPHLVAIMREVRPNVIMTWLYHADLLGTLGASMAGLGMRRVVWNLRCSDIDFTHYAISTRLIVQALARLSRRPWAVATNSLAGRHVHEAMGYAPRRWVHLPNGFDLDEWRPDDVDRAAVRMELGLEPTHCVIGLVARVDPQKDHSTFLAAAEQLASKRPETYFVLIGRGTKELIVPATLTNRVLALGERCDVPRLLRGLDLLALSSIGEGFSNVIGEAMATGLPCVVTDVGDAALIVADKGKVVPARDPRAMAAALADLVAAGPEQRAHIGARARDRVAANWSIADAAAAYRKLWQEAAAG